MKSKMILSGIAILMLFSLALTAEETGQSNITSRDKSPMKSSSTLSVGEKWALNEAIQDEYKARATYAKVIATFGEVRPFSNIIHAESRHIQALMGIYAKYNLPVPQDSWYGQVPVFRTLTDACAAGVQAELDNAAIYDTIMAKVNNPELLRIFTALRNASLERHLPAFQRGLNRGSGQGRGNGQGRGMGYGRGQGNSHGLGMGYGRGQGNGHARGKGYGRGQGRGNGQGGGMGYGRGQGSRGRGMGYGRGQMESENQGVQAQ